MVTPGFYYDDMYEDKRVYFLSGERAGNYWIDLSLDDPEWWKLTWTCIPKNIELNRMKYSFENPIQIKLI